MLSTTDYLFSVLRTNEVGLIGLRSYAVDVDGLPALEMKPTYGSLHLAGVDRNRRR